MYMDDDEDDDFTWSNPWRWKWESLSDYGNGWEETESWRHRMEYA